jgi:hypothetical protein
VAPPQLLNNYVSVEQDLAHVNRVVAADFVVWHAFVFTGILLLEERVVYQLVERLKVQLRVSSAFQMNLRIVHRI